MITRLWRDARSQGAKRRCRRLDVTERRLRVLHVTECYSAGVRSSVDALARNLSDVEHLLAYAGGRDPDTAFAEAIPLPALGLRRMLALRRLIGILQPDVVHAHSSWAGIYTRVIGAGRPVVYRRHCY